MSSISRLSAQSRMPVLLITFLILHATKCQHSAHRLNVKTKENQQGSASELQTQQDVIIEVDCDNHEDTWLPLKEVSGGRLLGGSPDDDSDGDIKEGHTVRGDEKMRIAHERKHRSGTMLSTGSFREQESKSGAEQLVKGVDFIIQGITPDGNCLFSTVADQLKHVGIECSAEHKYHLVIRRAAVDYVKNHKGEFTSFFPKDKPFNPINDDYGSVDQWITHMSEPGNYGDDVVISALTKAFNIHIGKLNPARGIGGKLSTTRYNLVVPEVQRKNNGEIFLVYNGRFQGAGGHYVALRPLKERKPFIAEGHKKHIGQILTQAAQSLSGDNWPEGSAGDKNPNDSEVDDKHCEAAQDDDTASQKDAQKEAKQKHSQCIKTFDSAAALVDDFNQEKDSEQRQALREKIKQCMGWFCQQSLATLLPIEIDEYTALAGIEGDQELLQTYFKTLCEKIPEQYEYGEENIAHALAASLPLFTADSFNKNTAPLEALSKKLLARLSQLSKDHLHAQSYATHGNVLYALYETVALLSRIRDMPWEQGGEYKKFKSELERLDKELYSDIRPEHLVKKGLFKKVVERGKIIKPGCYPYKYQIALLRQSLRRQKASLDLYDKTSNALKRVGKGVQGIVRLARGLRGFLSLKIDTKAFKKGIKAWREVLKRGTTLAPWYEYISVLGQTARYVLRDPASEHLLKEFKACFENCKRISVGTPEYQDLLRYGMVQQLVNLGTHTSSDTVRNACIQLLADLQANPGWAKEILQEAIKEGTQRIAKQIQPQKALHAYKSIVERACPHDASPATSVSSLEKVFERLRQKPQRPAALKGIHSTKDFIKTFQALGDSEEDGKQRALFHKYLEAYNEVVQEQLNKASVWFKPMDIQEYSQLAQLSRQRGVDAPFWKGYVQVWRKGIREDMNTPLFAKGIQQMLDVVNLESLEADPTLLIQLARSLLDHLTQSKARYTRESYESYKDVLIAIQYALTQIKEIAPKDKWEASDVQGLYKAFMQELEKVEQSAHTPFKCQALLLRTSLTQLRKPLTDLKKFYSNPIAEGRKVLWQLRNPIWQGIKGLIQCGMVVIQCCRQQGTVEAVEAVEKGGKNVYESFKALQSFAYDYLAQQIAQWIAMLKKAKDYLPTAGDLVQLSLAASEQVQDYAPFWEGLELLKEKAKKADEATRRLLYHGMTKQLALLAQRGAAFAEQARVVNHLKDFLQEAIQAKHQEMIQAALQGLKAASSVSDELQQQCKGILKVYGKELAQACEALQEQAQKIVDQEIADPVKVLGEKAAGAVKHGAKKVAKEVGNQMQKMIPKEAQQVISVGKKILGAGKAARKKVQEFMGSVREVYDAVNKKDDPTEGNTPSMQGQGRLFSIVTTRASLGGGHYEPLYELCAQLSISLDENLKKSQRHGALLDKNAGKIAKNVQKLGELDGSIDKILARLHNYESAAQWQKMTPKDKEVMASWSQKRLRVHYGKECAYVPRSSVEHEEDRPWPIADSYVKLIIVREEAARKIAEAEREADRKSRTAGASQRHNYWSYSDRQRIGAHQLIQLGELFEKRRLKNGQTGTPTKVLLLGEAGTGKTTLCHKLAYEWANGKLYRQFRAVYVLPVCKLAEEAYNQEVGYRENSLVNAIARNCFPAADNKRYALHKQYIREQLTRYPNEVLIVLDGYDERGNASERILEQAMDREGPLVLISRPHGVNIEEARKTADLEVENIGFCHEQAQKYVRRYFRDRDPKRGEQLCDLVSSQRAMRSLAQVPIKLQIACAVWTDKGKEKVLQKAAKGSMIALYDEMRDHTWRRYEARLCRQRFGKPKSKLNDDQGEEMDKITHKKAALEEMLYEVLGKIALQGFEHEQRIVSSRTKREVLAHEAYQGYKIQLEGMLRDTGFLERGLYFQHLSFREYFAGRELARQCRNGTANPLALFNQHKNQPQYREVLKFMVGAIAKQGEAGMKKVKNMFGQTSAGQLTEEQLQDLLAKLYLIDECVGLEIISIDNVARYGFVDRICSLLRKGLLVGDANLPQALLQELFSLRHLRNHPEVHKVYADTYQNPLKIQLDDKVEEAEDSSEALKKAIREREKAEVQDSKAQRTLLQAQDRNTAAQAAVSSFRLRDTLYPVAIVLSGIAGLCTGSVKSTLFLLVALVAVEVLFPTASPFVIDVYKITGVGKAYYDAYKWGKAGLQYARDIDREAQAAQSAQNALSRAYQRKDAAERTLRVSQDAKRDAENAIAAANTAIRDARTDYKNDEKKAVEAAKADQRATVLAEAAKIDLSDVDWGIEALLKRAQNQDSDWFARYQATTVLGVLAEVSHPYSQQVCKVLSQAAKDGEWLVRRAAVDALGKLDRAALQRNDEALRKQVYEILAQVAKNDLREEIRRAVDEVLEASAKAL